MRISDWSSDVCSSDLKIFGNIHEVSEMPNLIEVQRDSYEQFLRSRPQDGYVSGLEKTLRSVFPIRDFAGTAELDFVHYELEDPKYDRSEEHTSELQSLMRISYAVFCLKKNTKDTNKIL